MASYVPNGRQQFCDANGTPLALGSVGLYIPGTLTLKNSWQDAAQTSLNTNPIPLDAGGFATIYGTGSYRQIAKDSLGNTIWDKVVSAAVSTPPTAYDSGAIGNDSADDTAAITAANGVAGHKFMPHGTYKTTIAPTSLDGPFWGDGQIRDNASNKRGPWLSLVKQAPSSFGNENSIETAFNGDLSKVQIAMEHRVTGTATLGQPTSGYVYTPEAEPFYGYLYNASGWNNGTADTTGRTGLAFFRIKMNNAGLGDVVSYNFSGVVSGARAGATHFLANPAICGINGDLNAGGDGGYLNPFEVVCNDNGHDVASVGYVVNLNRTNATGALSVYWAGFRSQSIGSAACDAAFSASGKYNVGTDYTGTNFGTNLCAIAMKRGDRVYGNASTTDPNLLKATSLGTDYWVNSSSGWDFYIGGTLAFRASATTIQIATTTVAALPAAGTAGRRAFVVDANATTFASVVAGSGTNKVPVYDDGTNWRIG